MGNVVLKFAEGLADAIMTLIKDAIMHGGVLAKIGGALITPALRGLKKRLNVEEYGGALLLGVKAPFFICHGSSKAKSICSAVGVAVKCVQSGTVERIEQMEKASAATPAGEEGLKAWVKRKLKRE